MQFLSLHSITLFSPRAGLLKSSVVLVSAVLAAAVACVPTEGVDAGTPNANTQDAGEQNSDPNTDPNGDPNGAQDAGLVAACNPLSIGVGRWQASGACFGMIMTTTTSFDSPTCTATFGNWNMAMSVPAGAVITGQNVAFTGVGWDDCTGSITADGLQMTGSCSDGCALEMHLLQ